MMKKKKLLKEKGTLYPLLIRVLYWVCMAPLLCVLFWLLFGGIADFLNYDYGYWTSDDGCSRQVKYSKEWAYTDGKSDFYITDHLMLEDDYKIWVTAVYGDMDFMKSDGDLKTAEELVTKDRLYMAFDLQQKNIMTAKQLWNGELGVIENGLFLFEEKNIFYKYYDGQGFCTIDGLRNAYRCLSGPNLQDGMLLIMDEDISEFDLGVLSASFSYDVRR